jgi:hypothetical protein
MKQPSGTAGLSQKRRNRRWQRQGKKIHKNNQARNHGIEELKDIFSDLYYNHKGQTNSTSEV